jgi:hypothetical protein
MSVLPRVLHLLLMQLPSNVCDHLTLFACKRMLPFEALSFGLKVPVDQEHGDGAASREQIMDFGVSVGSGATLVCR